LTPSDEALIDGANRGEVEAFEALYRRYRDWVVAVAYRHTGDRDDALDVLQDTFAYLFGKFPGFALTARLTTFLYPVVKNLCVDLRKRRPTIDIDSWPTFCQHRRRRRRRAICNASCRRCLPRSAR
jgi:RNA polymerase sigma-70 factor (ECF subfamily)